MLTICWCVCIPECLRRSANYIGCNHLKIKYLNRGLSISLVCRRFAVVVMSTDFNFKTFALLPFKVAGCCYKSSVFVYFEKAAIISRGYSVLHRTKITRVSICSLRKFIENSTLYMLIASVRVPLLQRYEVVRGFFQVKEGLNLSHSCQSRKCVYIQEQ